MADVMDVSGTHSHPTPVGRFFQLLKEDRRDLVVILVYVVLNGLLMLAVPLTAQALVNTIAAGIFLQPLVVLSLILLGALLFVGMVRLFNLTLVEVLQQRIFARVALRLAYRLPRITSEALNVSYAPELANRFFDVITIQKSWSKILLDGPLAILQILIGLILLAFYSPILLAFDILFVIAIGLIIFGFGHRGLTTSIKESGQKYKVAGWLEELGRCHISFKMAGVPDYLMTKTDSMVDTYLEKRRLHFKVLFRQALGTYLLYALASAGILAVGGWLVIDRQLTLGQLVAAEIVVVGILASMEKLMRLVELFYDLLTGIEKIGHIVDMPMEPDSDFELPRSSHGGASVAFRNVGFEFTDDHSILRGVSLSIQPGRRVGLVGSGGVGKSTLVALLCGLLQPTRGMVEINGADVRDVSVDSLRQLVDMAGDSRQIFEGTIEENITMGREGISHADIRWAIELTELHSDLSRFPQGKQTRLVSEGRNLSLSQRQRLMIARAIVTRPELLILDETLSSIETGARLRILNRLLDRQYPWTVLIITHLPSTLMDLDEVFVLEDGMLVEHGSPKELLSRKSALMNDLFPDSGFGGTGRWPS